MSLISRIIRKEFKKNDDLRDSGLTTPEEILRFDDIVYGSDPQWHVLDVYRPKERAGEELPVIVSVHGGGWVYGDKERYQYYCMDLAKKGFAVVNFTYRLAPEAKFPASLEDTNDVFCWVLANSGAYGFDRKHVFAVGDSAGAHILGLYACICTNPGYAAKFAFRAPEGFCPTAIALNCGVYRVDRDNCNNKSLALLKELMPKQATKELWGQISALPYITGKFPPTYLMTASDDFLKGQAAILAAALTENDVPFLYRFYHNPQYVLTHVFHCDVRLKDAQACNDDECRFFKGFCEEAIPDGFDAAGRLRDEKNGKRLADFFKP